MSAAFPIVCPFCPLHCDDVTVAADGSVDVDCRRAAAGFQAALKPAAARVGPANCSIDEAVRRAAELLRDPADGAASATRPLVTVVTTGTDLASAKQLETLRDGGQVRLVVDAAPSGQAMLTTIRRDGILSATQGAIRNHADLIWSIGDFSPLPRIWQRLIDPDRPARHVAMAAGMTADETASISDALRGGDASQLPDEHARLCQALLASRYIAVVLGANAWPHQESMAAAVMLNQIVMRLATERRAVLLSLDAAATNRAVALWRTNEALQTYDEARPSGAARMGAASVPSSEVWVRLGDAASQDAAPAHLQIGGRDPARELAEIYLPAATVGVHRDGMVIRGDGSVTLPLEKFAPSELPTPAERLTALLGESIC